MANRKRSYRSRRAIDRRVIEAALAVASGVPQADAIRSVDLPRKTFYRRYREIIESRTVGVAS